MEPLSDGALMMVIQNLQLALDYQYQQLDQGSYDQEEPENIKEYLVKVDQVLGDLRAEYERRVARGAKLTPLADLPRIRLGPPAP